MEAPPASGWSGKHAVELYVQTYTTMLQSSGDIKIESLVQAHLGMGSVLHPLAPQPPPPPRPAAARCGPPSLRVSPPPRGDQPLPAREHGPEPAGLPSRAAR